MNDESIIDSGNQRPGSCERYVYAGNEKLVLFFLLSTECLLAMSQRITFLTLPYFTEEMALAESQQSFAFHLAYSFKHTDLCSRKEPFYGHEYWHRSSNEEYNHSTLYDDDHLVNSYSTLPFKGSQGSTGQNLKCRKQQHKPNIKTKTRHLKQSSSQSKTNKPFNQFHRPKRPAMS